MFDPSAKSVCYVLSGEFDNKYGPVVTCQYPGDIPGFNSSRNEQEAEDAAVLASLLIPNNVEHCTLTEPDCNTFTLYMNQNTAKYQLLPPLGESFLSTDVKGPASLNFVNLVKTQKDESNSRGAKIRSITLGTTLKDVDIFKPFLTEALVHVLDATNVSEIEGVLRNCFKALNSLDLNYIERSLYDNPLQQTLCCVRRSDSLKRLLNDDTQLGQDVLKVLDLSSHQEYRKKIQLKDGKLLLNLEGSLFDDRFDTLVEKPIEMSLFSHGPSHIKTGNSLVFRFLQKFIPLLGTLPSSLFSFKLIINSHNLPKEQICQFVMNLSHLMGCTKQAGQTEYFDGTSALILPYAEVSMIKSIKDYFESCEGTNIFAIVGTANSIFQHHDTLWDYYYDIDKDVLQTCGEEHAGNRNSLWDSSVFKKFLQKNLNDVGSLHISDSGRIGLMAAFVNLIIEENPKEEDILSTLRKINVLQIESQLREIGENSTCSTYVTGFKDLIKFNDLFTTESLTVIVYFATLDQVISGLYDSGQSLSKRQDLISQLHELLVDISAFIESRDDRLISFVNIGLNYSPFQYLSRGNLMIKDFSSENLHHDVFDAFKKNKSWLSVVQDRNTAKLFETFASHRALDLLSMPLLLNSDIHKPRAAIHSKSLDRVSTDTMSVSSGKSSSSSGETRRPRSMSLKWIRNLPKNIDNLIDGQGTTWAEPTPIASPPDRSPSLRSSSGRTLSPASSISSSSSRKFGSRSFRNKTENVKRLATQILSKIKSHPLGEFLINEEMSPYCQTLFQVSEAEYMSNR